MKEPALSICERNFILNAASQAKRLDGRKLDEFRDLNIYFGSDWGLCYTSLGETRVITQVACEVQEPKTVRPNEGLLFINVEVSSMAAAHIEPGRSSDVNVHLNRLLEKCIKDSKAVDLESLCLIAEEKVWALRVDVNILNHDGNLIQAASISTLAALAHFRRPDVTTDGEEIIIHGITERDSIPLTLHHYPVCINFALLNNGESVLADPTSMEERISDAALIFGVNAYGELCGLHLGGNALVEPTLILKYSQRASKKARETVEAIKMALSRDADARTMLQKIKDGFTVTRLVVVKLATVTIQKTYFYRQSKSNYGLVESIHWDKIKSLSDSRLKVQLNRFKPTALAKAETDVDMNLVKADLKSEIIDLGDNCAELVSLRGKNLPDLQELKREETVAVSENQGKVIQLVDDWGVEKIGEGGASKWEAGACMEDSDPSESKDDNVAVTPKSEIIKGAEISEDSEEEVVILKPQGIGGFVETFKSTNTKSKSQHKTQGNGTDEVKSSDSKNVKKRNRRKFGKN